MVSIEHNHFLKDFNIIQSSEVFGCLWKFLDMVMSFQKSWYSQDENLMPLTKKKLAGI